MPTSSAVFLACAAGLFAFPANAKVVTVSVDATSGPWIVAANRKLMPYGTGDERPSVSVPIDTNGGRIAVYADGTTDTADQGKVPPVGIEDKVVDDTLRKKARYPSFYTPKILYPAHLHALVGAFVDGKGMVVGRPFVIGEGIRVPVPDDAAALSFGFNDVAFTGAKGSLKVTVELPD